MLKGLCHGSCLIYQDFKYPNTLQFELVLRIETIQRNYVPLNQKLGFRNWVILETKPCLANPGKSSPVEKFSRFWKSSIINLPARTKVPIPSKCKNMSEYVAEKSTYYSHVTIIAKVLQNGKCFTGYRLKKTIRYIYVRFIFLVSFLLLWKQVFSARNYRKIYESPN